MLDAFRRELSYTLRTLRREPTFVIGVVATFAIAIGANAAMLGLVTRLMLSPPPGIREPEQIARVGVVRTDRDGESFDVDERMPVERLNAAIRAMYEIVSKLAVE